MIIKKYLANSVEEALALVKQELGSSHVILTTRQVQNSGFLGWFSATKVEVTAAVEEDDLKAYTNSKLGKKKREKSAPLGNLNESLQELKELVHEEPAPATYGDPRIRKREPAPRVKEMRQTSKKLVEAFAHPPAEAHAPTLEELRRVVREEMQGAQRGVSVGPMEDNEETVVGSVRFLMAKGIGRKKALAIQEKLGNVDLGKASPERTKHLNAIKNEIAMSLKTTGPIKLNPSEPTIVALVGPTGVGKTTTLAKLAAEFRENQRKRVALISLDNVKLGAREQIEVISREYALPVRTATNLSQLKEAIAAFYDQDLILIDTGGRSQYQATEVLALGDFLTSDPRIQIYLALSATTKDVDCMGIIRQFTKMPLKGLIFTKLDETIAYGMMVSVCEKSGLPISYITNGQKIPRDIQSADSDEIAKSILMQHNSAACERIRQMATG